MTYLGNKLLCVWHQVDREDKVYNMFVDKEGNPQNVYVGRMDELKDFDIKTLGGIPVEDLKKASDGRFNGTVTAFEDPNDDKVALPPNAPLELDEVRVSWICSSGGTCRINYKVEVLRVM